MNCLSVCSGIEAATVAWHELGWKPVAFSEIEKFPCEVLAHHYPTVPNLGDMTKYHGWPKFNIDVLVGGTPCQAFSVAGLRQGLADPRGNLTLTFLGVAAKYMPEYIVWENVPGVLSSITTEHPDEMAAPDDLQEGEERECVEDYEADSSHALSCFLEGLQELGYGCALRCFDAQYFGLAQRRKRVFVVGCLGDWQRAATILFEPESVCGNNPPSRSARQDVTGTLSSRSTGGGGLGTDFDLAGGCIPIQEPGKRTGRSTSDRGVGIGIGAEGDSMYTLQAGAVHGVAHTLRAEGFDASEDGTGRGTPLVPVISPTITSNYSKQVDSSDTSHGPNVVVTPKWPAEVAPTLNAHFGDKQGLEDQHALNGGGYLSLPKISLCLNAGAMGRIDWESETLIPTRQGGFPSDPIAFSCKDHAADAGEVSPTLRSMGHANSHANAGGQVAVAFQQNQLGEVRTSEIAGTINTNSNASGRNTPMANIEMSVRRLTPKECERLQGFPDDYTRIARGKKSADQCPDGPRYKALGNSMAVPCMRWIGKRIAAQAAVVTAEDWS